MNDEIFLMSVEEYKKYKENIPSFPGWWWLRSPGDCQDEATYVYYDKSIICNGGDIYDDYGAVRPVIRLSRCYQLGTLVSKYGYTWVCIDEKLAICETTIGYQYFDKNSNIYVDSFIRKYLLDWVEKRKHRLGEKEEVVV